MRKIILGLIFGFILYAPMPAFAADSVQAYLSPSRVLFHFKNAVKEIDENGSNGVLYYKDRSYIPLRTFATNLGATVDYEAPSPANGNLNKIDIFCPSDVIENKPTQTSTDYATGPIEAYFSPSQVSIHMGNTIKVLDVSGDSGVIYYQDRSYVPLRAFVTAMGTTVDYEAASAINGNLNKIDIYSSSTLAVNNLTLHDPDGYVSIGDLQYNVANGEYNLFGGTIRINKDLDGKSVHIYSGGDASFDYYNPIYVLNEAIDHLKAGDIRPFKVSYGMGSYSSLNFNIRLKDSFQASPLERGSNIPSRPLMFEGGPMGESDDSLFRVDRPTYFYYRLLCFDSNITVQPFKVKLEIYKTDQENQSSELVFSWDLPVFEGTFKKNYGYQGLYLWDKRDFNGQYVEPGWYRFKFVLPEEVSYQIEGSNNINTFKMKAPAGGDENCFEIQK